MTLTDTGPLVALIDRDEPDHDRCRSALDELPLPLVTTWPAFTEAMYLLHAAAGWPAQEALWRMAQRGALALVDVSAELMLRSADLMRRYRDHPMDLADATLVAVAEERNWRRVFTLDGHFRSYRTGAGHHLDVVPA